MFVQSESKHKFSCVVSEELDDKNQTDRQNDGWTARQTDRSKTLYPMELCSVRY